MRKSWLIIGSVVLVAAMLGLAACSSAGPVIPGQQQGISVNGEGKVSVTPDIVYVQLGIDVQKDTIADAQAQASITMTAVIAALKANGVAEKDIQTSQFSINKVTRWDNTKQVETTVGYRVTNMVTVKIRDISKAGVTIDAAAKAGGDYTRIDSTVFSVDKPETAQGQARQKAMASAKAKAEQLALLAGVKLGKPISIAESSYSPSPLPYSYSRSAMAVPAPAVDTPVQAGEEDVIINVQIVYGIQ